MHGIPIGVKKADSDRFYLLCPKCREGACHGCFIEREEHFAAMIHAFRDFDTPLARYQWRYLLGLQIVEFVADLTADF